jgi:hypothetical protein
VTDTIEARFAAETALLGLELLPGQEGARLEALRRLCEMVALVGADHPMAAKPAHAFVPIDPPPSFFERCCCRR